MKKSELWAAYVKKNPHWETKNVTLTPAGLKKLFNQTFDKGHSLGIENGKAMRDQESKSESSDTGGLDFLKSILKPG